LDCPLKRPPTFDIALQDSIELALKGIVVVVPKTVDKDATKKTNKIKPKPKKSVVQLDHSNEDVPIQDSLKNLVVSGPSSSNIEAKLPTSKRKKTSSSLVVLVPTSFHIFELPPKLKGMMCTLAPLSTNHISLDLILKDSFVRIIKEKKKNDTFGALYDDIMAFLSNVSSFFFFVFLFISFLLL